jgi:hypothetical protein
MFTPVYVQLGVAFSEMIISKIGYSISPDGTSLDQAPQSDQLNLVNMVKEYLDDYYESWKQEMNLMMWNDGLAFPDAFPGIRTFVTSDVTTNRNVFGINQALVPLWRNNVAANIAVSPANRPIIEQIKKMARLSTIYGPANEKIAVCGGDFFDALTKEFENNSTYGQDKPSGVAGMQDHTIRTAFLANVQPTYDPTLDKIGEAKSCYLIDKTAIKPLVFSGADRRKIKTQSPHDQLNLYMAEVSALCLSYNRRNTSAFLSIA